MNNQYNNKKCIFCAKKIPNNSLKLFCNKSCKNKFLVIDYIDHPINQENQDNNST